MLQTLVRQRVQEWISRDDCPVSALLQYLRAQGKLRPPQIEAIETWLFLKIVGNCRPLADLVASGTFTDNVDLDAMALPMAARDYLRDRPEAQALLALALSHDPKGQPQMPQLATRLRSQPERVDAKATIQALFGNVDYADYLFSLPMGAGKTFLMAALIHLDLYFADLYPDDPRWARNFLVLIPSGLKTSIVPSLRSIERFDPTWVLPEPAATAIHQRIRFAVLDESKAAKKSNKARNPNAQKVAAAQPFEDAFGYVFVVNAEKVILDHVPDDAAQQSLFENEQNKEHEAYERANELRRLLGRLPALALHIDEVHHATGSEIKLRKVVSGWAKAKDGIQHVNSVLGYSGTPYAKREVEVDEALSLTFEQITNTVFHYPLTEAIRTFLKKPTVRTAHGLSSEEIIRRGVKEFRERYDDTVYADGTRAKLAIYCGNIERLETEVRPLLLTLGVPADETLVFHKGNKDHKMTPEAARAFAALDRPESPHRVVLLVQIGKEGWDCRSLTGVILSQAKDSPSNMVLQTSTRCLREVTPQNRDATALVWLSEENAKHLDKQLREEQRTSIAEINALGGGDTAEPMRKRHDRSGVLGLPNLELVQLAVVHREVVSQEAQPGTALAALTETLERKGRRFYQTAVVQHGTAGVLSPAPTHTNGRTVYDYTGVEAADFQRWLLDLHRDGLGIPSRHALNEHANPLRTVFEAITYADDHGVRRFNAQFHRPEVERAVRLAFHDRRTLDTHAETVFQEARLVAKLPAPVPVDPLVYPDPAAVQRILDLDAGHDPDAEARKKYEEAKALLETQGLGDILQPPPALASSPPVDLRGRAFHYLPYDFRKTRLERDTLDHLLTLDAFQDRPRLSIFFNGEQHLTEFIVHAHEQRNGRWLRVGIYTPDFLIVERDDDGAFRRVLILETKGKGYQAEDGFVKRRAFTESWFVPENNRHAGYERFAYRVLSDEHDEPTRLGMLHDWISTFFA